MREGDREGEREGVFVIQPAVLAQPDKGVSASSSFSIIQYIA